MRIVLDNELPQSTAIHFHGIDVPDAMDGVPDVTQPPMKPGEEVHLRVRRHRGPRVGMYHSHHHAEHQVPDGLLGVFHIGDAPVPAGVTVTQEMPMVLNDAGVIGLSRSTASRSRRLRRSSRSSARGSRSTTSTKACRSTRCTCTACPQLVIAKDGIPLPQPYRADTLVGRAGRALHRARARRPRCPACGRSTATSSPTPRATTGCSAW